MTDSLVTLLTAFAAGLVSFLSPCVLPLVPGYLSFISGASIEDLQSAGVDSHVTRRAFVSSLWFGMGFSAVFIALGASATTVGAFLLQKLAVFRQVAGVIIIILGLHLIGVLLVPFLHYKKAIDLRKKPLSAAGAFFVGAAFAFGWTPCIGPILAGILGLASTQETVGQGMLLLACYSLGLGVPFMLASLGVGAFLRFSAKFRKHLRAVEVASGILLVAIGVLIFTDRLTLLTRYLSFLERFSLWQRGTS